jgi:NADPH:quinone reductase-like Zn-dependent oxidoreductase
MMKFVGKHRVSPIIHKIYRFDDAAVAIQAINEGQHFGKLVLSY